MKTDRREYYKKNQKKYKERYNQKRQYILAQCKEYRDTHPEKRRAACKGWWDAHPTHRIYYEHTRRARKNGNGGSYTLEELNTLFKEQDSRCFYCGQLLEAYHIDHKTPISRGGSNNIDNIALACAPCNLSKYTKTAEEFSALRNGQ
jgi:5-methylcytosine-specific restriction endonuclease McrA